jgi:hypothetical protein
MILLQKFKVSEKKTVGFRLLSYKQVGTPVA